MRPTHTLYLVCPARTIAPCQNQLKNDAPSLHSGARYKSAQIHGLKPESATPPEKTKLSGLIPRIQPQDKSYQLVINCCAIAQASASALWTCARLCGSKAERRDRTWSIITAIWSKRILRLRKAATAISLAAFNTAGAVP